MGQSITQGELLDRLERHATQSSDGSCSCTLVIGSGFSYGIVPTTTQIVREELPWFIWCHASQPGGPKPADFVNDTRRRQLSTDATEHAKRFWGLVHEWAQKHAGPGEKSLGFCLDAEGYPDRVGITKAYMAAFSTACPHGLATEAMTRRFLADLIKKSGKRLNPAHLYLASLLSECPKLFRTIFTTNFDPLLQRSLQLVNTPYFVSDRPDVMQHPDDDGEVDALHLVHVHGSIYRYLLLNTPEDIESFAERNQPLLLEYFRKHAVLIVGYGGWDDAIYRALEKVDRFSQNLYWCDLGATPDQSGISERGRAMLSKQPNAFYVPIKGADDLLVALHQRLTGHALPRLFRDPISVIAEQFETCDLTGIKVPRVGKTDEAERVTSKPGQTPGVEGFSATMAETDALLDLGEEVRNIRDQIDGVRRVMNGGSPQPGEAQLAELRSKATDAYFGPAPEQCIPLIGEILALLAKESPDFALWLLRRGTAHALTGRLDEAIEDFTAAIQLPGAPDEQVAMAFCNRGVAYSKAGRVDEAIADFTSASQHPGAPDGLVATVLVSRGVAHGNAGRVEEAIADFTAASQISGGSAEQVAKAIFNRGVAHGQAGRLNEEIADYTTAIQMPGASPDLLVRALVSRGATHLKAGRLDEAMADYTAAIQLPGAPGGLVATVLVYRGIAHSKAGRLDEAIADYTAAIQLPGAPAEQVATALVNRGLASYQSGPLDEAMADYTAAIQLPGAPPGQVANALVNRGAASYQAGRLDDAMADYTAAIQLSGAPAELVAMAHNNRGVAHGEAGRLDEAIQEFAAVIQLPDAPAEQVARALLGRGAVQDQAGWREEARQDFIKAIELGGAPPEIVARAQAALDRLNGS